MATRPQVGFPGARPSPLAASFSVALQHEGLDQLGDLLAAQVPEDVHLRCAAAICRMRSLCLRVGELLLWFLLIYLPSILLSNKCLSFTSLTLLLVVDVVAVVDPYLGPGYLGQAKNIRFGMATQGYAFETSFL